VSLSYKHLAQLLVHSVIPNYRHPAHPSNISKSLASLLPRTGPMSTLHKVVPIEEPFGPLELGSRTHVMSILNVTPDSFSDGGDHFHLGRAVESAIQHVQDGATIIDVGGMSTRPGAADISEEEEANRVVPVIRALREAGISVPISIDTFRASVAEAACAAGASIVNDISAGALDPKMLETCASLGVPVVLMHMRGDPSTMTSLTSYAEDDDDVLPGVRRELADRVRSALLAGVRRWNIILDPGVGFAKDLQGNLQLIRDLPRLTEPGSELEGYPVLVGASRKRFLGTLTGREEPKQREFATAAASVAAIAGGADIVRVHDVRGLSDASKVADAVYRQPTR
jgi:dihydroneopterin aldolase/2-amino-4-hydroxy-6-hydroxymethyldihydropteridine diphosphokinase/dihydropteroate synthase